MVITVLVVMAGILFPVYAKAQQVAFATQTLFNVKKMGTAVQLYIADNTDCYPLTTDGPIANIQNWPDGHVPARTNTWVMLVRGYGSGNDVYVDSTRGDVNNYFANNCSMTDQNPADCTTGPSTYFNQELHPMFGYNYPTFGPLQCNAGCTDVGFSQSVSSSFLPNPSGTIMLAQSYNFNTTIDPLAPWNAGSFTLQWKNSPGPNEFVISAGPACPGSNCSGDLNFYSSTWSPTNPVTSLTTVTFADSSVSHIPVANAEQMLGLGG